MQKPIVEVSPDEKQEILKEVKKATTQYRKAQTILEKKTWEMKKAVALAYPKVATRPLMDAAGTDHRQRIHQYLEFYDERMRELGHTCECRKPEKPCEKCDEEQAKDER